MSKTSMEVVMSEDLKTRLSAASARIGKTLQELMQEALYTYVEDLEDGVLSDVALTEEGLEHLLPEGDASGAMDRTVLEVSHKTA